MKRLLILWRARPVLTAAFLLACAMTLFFGGRFTVYTIYWANHREATVEPWMTVGYIARSWGLEPRTLEAAAGLPVPEMRGRPLPLDEIARGRGVPVAEVIAEVEAAIARLNAAGSGE